MKKLLILIVALFVNNNIIAGDKEDITNSCSTVVGHHKFCRGEQTGSNPVAPTFKNTY